MRKEANQINFIEFPAKTTTDLASDKKFYGEVFGWSFNDWGEDYIDTEDSGLGIGFNADPSHRPNKPLVAIYCANLELALSRVIAAGGHITKEIFSFPGGRRFHFKDPSSNELAVWSDQ